MAETAARSPAKRCERPTLSTLGTFQELVVLRWSFVILRRGVLQATAKCSFSPQFVPFLVKAGLQNLPRTERVLFSVETHGPTALAKMLYPATLESLTNETRWTTGRIHRAYVTMGCHCLPHAQSLSWGTAAGSSLPAPEGRWQLYTTSDYIHTCVHSQKIWHFFYHNLRTWMKPCLFQYSTHLCCAASCRHAPRQLRNVWRPQSPLEVLLVLAISEVATRPATSWQPTSNSSC